ncbi:hypothetical protein V8C86DRAFT_1669400 [Haematococcus lacustris]
MDWADAAAIAAIVRQRGYKRLALQFPDSLLSHSPRVASAVQELLGPGHSVAVLADTAFNAESVDEVAAQHMSADCVVQFGRSSLAPTAHIPAIHVLPRHPPPPLLPAAQDLAAALRRSEPGRRLAPTHPSPPPPTPPAAPLTPQHTSPSPLALQPSSPQLPGLPAAQPAPGACAVLLVDQGLLHASRQLASCLQAQLREVR